MRRAIIPTILTLLMGTAALPLWAAEQETNGVITGDLSDLGDEEIEARVAFLVDRLEQGQRNAQIWQYGFTSGWSLGIGIGAAQAIITDSRSKRVSGIVQGVKGAVGTARLLVFSHPGRLGADAVLAIPGDSRAAGLERLKAAEAQLQRTARFARGRRAWLPHLVNVGINVAGGGVILGVGKATDAALSMGIGMLAGEIMVWTRPWRSLRDLEDYRRRFTGNGPSGAAVSWRLVPTLGGARLEVHF